MKTNTFAKIYLYTKLRYETSCKLLTNQRKESKNIFFKDQSINKYPVFSNIQIKGKIYIKTLMAPTHIEDIKRYFFSRYYDCV